MMLRRNEIIPMYHQIADFLIKEIVEGVYKEGDKIPTEVELISQFNVSRTTIRLAMNQLIEKGLVEKKSGKGTFVKKSKVYHPIGEFKSLYNTLLESNISAETELVDFRRVKGTDHVCEQLELPKDSDVLEVRRLYHVKNIPIALAKISIHPKYGNQISLVEAKNHPVYQIIEKKHRINIKEANLEIFSSTPSAETANHLRMNQNESALGMERILYTTQDEPVEQTIVYFRADSYRFTIKIPNRDEGQHEMNHLSIKVKKDQ